MLPLRFAMLIYAMPALPPAAARYAFRHAAAAMLQYATLPTAITHAPPCDAMPPLLAARCYAMIDYAMPLMSCHATPRLMLPPSPCRHDAAMPPPFHYAYAACCFHAAAATLRQLPFYFSDAAPCHAYASRCRYSCRTLLMPRAMLCAYYAITRAHGLPVRRCRHAPRRYVGGRSARRVQRLIFADIRQRLCYYAAVERICRWR